MKLLVIYMTTVSVVSVVLTVYDKMISSHRRARRIPEKSLFFWASIGGAATMYLTMLIIRHKTKHKRFMLGLPAILLLHLGALWWFCFSNG